MKRILLLTTGGTIASTATEEGLAPGIAGQGLKDRLNATLRHYDVTVRDILHLDSSNIQPEEWQFIARNVYDAREEYDGIVITHGTDTMGYTAAMLSYMLLNIRIPVVLTGSQLPIDHPLSDAYENLRAAFAMANSGMPGVYLAFNRKIIRGTRAVKTRTTGFDAFESVNCPEAAVVNGHGLVCQLPVSLPSEPCVLRDRLCRDVILVKLTPGLNPDLFDMLLNMHYKGIVVEAFGAGGIHFIRRDLISKLQKAVSSGIAVVVCSQCLYERSDFSLYQTGQKALEQGVIQSYDMTTEAAMTKLMWALGQTEELAEVRRLFATSLAGEVTL